MNKYFFGFYLSIVLLFQVRLSFCEEDTPHISLEINKYRRGEYLVIEKYLGDTGEIIVVKDIKNKADTVFLLKELEHTYFLELFQDMLLTDCGTGADSRLLTIYNLKSRKKVLECYYTEPVTLIGKDSLSIWIYDSNIRSNSKRDPKICPEYKKWEKEGFDGAVVFFQHYFDLKRLKLFKTDHWKCEPVQ